MVPETASDPFISIDAQLDELKAKDLFKVESPEPAYWRLLTLDEFDGEGWRSGDPDGSESGQIETVPTVLPQLPEYTWPADSTLGKFTFRVLSDDLASTDALPMAQTAEEIAGRIGDITWDPYRAQAFIATAACRRGWSTRSARGSWSRRPRSWIGSSSWLLRRTEGGPSSLRTSIRGSGR
jgi:hypothetical protein